MTDELSFDAFAPVLNEALEMLGTEIGNQQKALTAATGYAPLPDILSALNAEHWIDNGGMRAEDFRGFFEVYLKHSVKLHHPLHAAHQVSVPDYPAALAAMANGLLNNPMAIYEMGPSAAALEFAVVNWMLRKVGWRPQPVRASEDDVGNHAAGVLTHGGSLANLTSFLAARARVAPEAWEQGTPDDLVVLVPPSSHYSVARAIAILGLGANAIVDLPADHFGVVQPERVPERIAEVEAGGKRCMALMANACATATGLHDPLRPLGEICAAHNIWYHVDGCHGASALLSPEKRHYLDGIELADSIVWDAHKMLQVPALCAAVLFRNAASFEMAFDQDASYLAYGRDVDSYDSLPRAIECTKSSMSFKLFMNLAWRGETGLGEFVSARYDAASRFYAMINETSDFYCPYEPETNILCFGFKGHEAQHELIRDQLVYDGKAHLTSAKVDGRVWLRVTIMNPATDDDALIQVLDAIRHAV
ncbi:MAG: pyridoxal-dependent decarboxylase [Pseudomonadota bacterium]